MLVLPCIVRREEGRPFARLCHRTPAEWRREKFLPWEINVHAVGDTGIVINESGNRKAWGYVFHGWIKTGMIPFHDSRRRLVKRSKGAS